MTAAPGLTPGLTPTLGGAASKPITSVDRARSTAREFEALFLNAMLQPMFSGVGDSEFNGGHAGGVWRSFLTDEYAKSFAQNGGVGIADHVYRFLIEQQEHAPAAVQGAYPQ